MKKTGLMYSRRNLQTTRWQSVVSSALLSTRTSNTDRNKSAETLQKSVKQRWPNESLHQLRLCASLCWKKMFIRLNALLQHSCSRSHQLLLASTLHHHVGRSHPSIPQLRFLMGQDGRRFDPFSSTNAGFSKTDKVVRNIFAATCRLFSLISRNAQGDVKVEWQLFKAALVHLLLGYADGKDSVWRIMAKKLPLCGTKRWTLLFEQRKESTRHGFRPKPNLLCVPSTMRRGSPQPPRCFRVKTSGINFGYKISGINWLPIAGKPRKCSCSVPVTWPSVLEGHRKIGKFGWSTPYTKRRQEWNHQGHLSPQLPFKVYESASRNDAAK